MKMSSLIAELGIASDRLLDKLGGCSLEQLAQGLPSALSTDVHILAGEKCLTELSSEASGDELQSTLWEAFHQLSQSHATLYHHRHQQKLLRQNRTAQKNKKGCGVDKSLQQFENVLLKPALLAHDTRDMLAALPSGWTVLQVTLGVGDSSGEGSKGRLLRAPAPRHSLHLARVTTGSQPSLIMQTVSSCEGSLLEEMERIKMQNKVINKDYADNAAKYSAMREQLDARLKGVVSGVECSWLGVWRCLVAGSVPNVYRLIEAVEAAAASAGVAINDHQRDKIVMVMCCPSVQLSPHEVSTKKQTTGLHVFQFQLRSAIATVLGESVRSDQVHQLCVALQRTRDTYAEARCTVRGPLIIILDKNIVSLPWEALPCLTDQPVTRMPSLQSLHALYQLQKEQGVSSVLERGVDCNSGYYLLDPDSNLPRTQQRLSAAFTATGWPGMTAARPSHQQFKEALTQKDVFVYVGHGSGSQYLPGDLVEELSCRACALLYGCSSVRLQPRGHVPDPWGVLLNYLLANCPCVVGMLWEVTDKDTDLLTSIMLDHMEAARRGDLKGPSDLPTIIARSRHRCNRFLTASAIVVYGLPCSLRVSGSGDT